MPDGDSWIADEIKFDGICSASYQCTSLCAADLSMEYDAQWLNASVLCRCRLGSQGRARMCSGCPVHTYSTWLKGTSRLISVCAACPPYSSAGELKASQLDCQCALGFFRNMTEGAVSCARCAPYSNTTVIGALRVSECACKPQTNTRRIGDECGCIDANFMDHVISRCLPCGSGVLCKWESNATRSLTPPPIKAGYWSTTHPVTNVAAFPGHLVLNCFSQETCQENNRCVLGRKGRACSLCKPEFYGGADSECKDCAIPG